MVSFGAEDEQAQLQKVLSVLLSPEFEPVFRLRLMGGGSYAAARSQTVEDLAGEETAAVLTRPNNILGIEYLKAAHRLGFSPQWAAIPRKGAGHDQHGEEKGLMSASYVRHLLEAGDWSEAQKGLPEICLPLYQQAFVSGAAPVRLGNLERNMLALLRTRSLDWLKNLPDVSEGLENRLYAGIRQARSIVELYQLVQTKRYPQSRARRMALHGFLGVTASMQKIRPPYLRIWGFGFGGEEILQADEKNGCHPVFAVVGTAVGRIGRRKPVCATGSGGYRPIRAWNAKTAVLRLGIYCPSLKERRSWHVGKSIPYQNIIMCAERESLLCLKEPTLPSGVSFRLFCPGDEKQGSLGMAGRGIRYGKRGD